MSNWNRDSALQEQQTQDSRVNVFSGCGSAILFSLGTSFSICLITAKLFHYYVHELFQHGLDAGFGIIWIILFGFPIVFVIALTIWQIVGRQSGGSTSENIQRWLISLLMGLVIGYLILLVASNNWTTESYRAFVNTQGLIFIGYPFFSLGVYTISLGVSRSPRRLG